MGQQCDSWDDGTARDLGRMVVGANDWKRFEPVVFSLVCAGDIVSNGVRRGLVQLGERAC